MRLTQVAIDRPIIIWMVFAGICLFGIISMSKIPAELNPRIQFPTITVITIYPGASPEEVEGTVTKPIEDALYSVNNVEIVESHSQENLSVVVIDFLIGTDLDQAAVSVRENIDAIRVQFPSDVKQPLVSKVDINTRPVLLVGVTGEGRNPEQLRAIVDRTIKPRLERVQGVASVDVTGGDVREIQVIVNRATLEEHGLSLSEVVMGLQAASMNVPSGQITQSSRSYSVRMLGEFKSLDDIRKVQIPRLPSLPDLSSLAALGPAASMMAQGGGGPFPPGMKEREGPDRPFTIGEVAKVVDTMRERETITRVQQQESVGLIITKLADANTVTVAEGIRHELDQLRTTLQKDLRLFPSQDQSRRVIEALHDVNVAILLGAALAILVVYLFLHDIRGTVIVAIAIPTSILATFIPMYFAGFTLNQMTMLGLALSVGILVDDSIVVLENIHRHRIMDLPSKEAALMGRIEIGLAALAITLVDVVVFVPIAFMGGMVGQFFRQFALTAAFATLFSLFVSFTLTPSMAAHWYRDVDDAEESASHRQNRFDAAYSSLQRWYRGILARALRRRAPVTVLAIGTLAVSLLAGWHFLDFSLLPKVDQRQLRVRVEMHPDASLHATERAIIQAEKIIKKDPDVKTVFSHAGQVVGGFLANVEKGNHLGSIQIELVPRASGISGFLQKLIPSGAHAGNRSDSDVAAHLRRRLARIPGVTFTVAPEHGFEGVLRPIVIEISGSDLERIRNVADRIRSRIAEMTGILNPEVSLRFGKPEIQVKIDREKAASFNLLVGQVARAMREAIEGNTDASYREGSDRYTIRVHYDRNDRDSTEDVRRIVVGRTGSRPVYVEDVATVLYGSGPAEIMRKNRERTAVVSADLAPGFSAGAMKDQIESAIRDIPLADTRRNWGGEVEQIVENMMPWLQAMALSTILVYMLLASLFNSLVMPLAVLAALPMALVGAIAGLLLTGEDMTMVAMIGTIMLVGLVGKNAILLVDYTSTLRLRGMSRSEAILQAGTTRLRAILMTTLTIVFAMLPIALRFGRGSEIRAPMAITVLGGLAVSTVLTLILVPVFYTYIDDLTARFFGGQSRRGRQAAETPGDGHHVSDSGISATAVRPAAGERR